MMTRTHIVLATFAIVLVTPFAHAERYNVRGADGRFVKQSTSTALTVYKPKSTGMVVYKPSSTAMTVHEAPKQHIVDAAFTEIHEPAHIAAAPASKGTLGGWLRRNFTIRSGERDKLTAARALRKAGRMEEASQHLNATEKPQGFFERVAFGHAAMKLNTATRSSLKESARANDIGRTHDAFLAMQNMESGGKTTWLSRWRAGSAQKSGMKSSLRIASRQGNKGDFESASRTLDLAAGLSNGNDRAIARGDRRFVKQATRAATRAAKSGDINATVSALDVAMNANGSDAMSEPAAHAIFDKAFDHAIPKMLKSAKASFNHGDEQGAAEQLAEVQQLQEEQGRPSTGRAHRTQVELNALVGARASRIRAQREADRSVPEAKTSEASNGAAN
ncbi:MAG: hypothetical protein ABI321_06925 [Polyangia bacterium]